jgi:hypothetical protein
LGVSFAGAFASASAAVNGRLGVVFGAALDAAADEAEGAVPDELVVQRVEGVAVNARGVRRPGNEHAGNTRLGGLAPDGVAAREHAPSLDQRGGHHEVAHGAALLEGSRRGDHLRVPRGAVQVDGHHLKRPG